MLQQTQVATVVPYFDRWMNAAPDIDSLAGLSPTHLHRLWEGLGYYTRARNLQKAAAQIITEHNGRFPEQYEAILQLSGIGRYTAGAVSSIAFNQRQPIVDGNVIRVLSRLHGIEGDPKDRNVVEKFWNVAGLLVAAADRMRSKTRPSNRSLKFSGNCSMLNQSLMELGATICTPKNPSCKNCPLRRNCFARTQNRISEFPRLPTRAKPTPRRFIALIISNRKKFQVRQRAEDVVNAHLWELPNVEVGMDALNGLETALAQLGLNGAEAKHVATVKHSITRYRMQTECYRVLGDQRTPPGIGQLMTVTQLKKLPFASAHRKLIDLI